MRLHQSWGHQVRACRAVPILAAPTAGAGAGDFKFLSTSLLPVHPSHHLLPDGALLPAHTPFSKESTFALTKAMLAWAERGTFLCTEGR